MLQRPPSAGLRWSAAGIEIPHRPQEVSEDVFGSGEEEHRLFRKPPICVREYGKLSHRKRDGPQGPSLFLLWLLISLRSPAGGIAAVDHENSHAYQYQCR